MLARTHGLKHFRIGNHFVGCCFIPTSVFNKYCTEYIGRESGQWVFPVSGLRQILGVVEHTGSLKDAVSQTLNFEIEDNMTLCVYKKPFDEAKLSLPRKNTPGANSQWVPGGYTASGIPEIIIPREHVNAFNIIPVRKCPKPLIQLMNTL